jgi:uncharacterized protein
MAEFSFLNSELPPTTLSGKFTLKAPPKTDIYAAPAHGYVFTAPIAYKQIQTSQFHRLRVTVTLRWTHLYDQGGLILFFPATTLGQVLDAKNLATKESHPKWVKAGVEVNDQQAFASVVARDEWADWSLGTLPAHAQSGGARTAKATIAFERHGNALKVLLVEGEKETLLREVQWVFCDERHSVDCYIGVYVARPDSKDEADGDLEVEFEGLEIQ